MNDLSDFARWSGASVVSLATTAAGAWTGESLLTVLGLVVALLTIVERIYAIRIKRRQQRIQEIELERLTGRRD